MSGEPPQAMVIRVRRIGCRRPFRPEPGNLTQAKVYGELAIPRNAAKPSLSGERIRQQRQPGPRFPASGADRRRQSGEHEETSLVTLGRNGWKVTHRFPPQVWLRLPHSIKVLQRYWSHTIRDGIWIAARRPLRWRTRKLNRVSRDDGDESEVLPPPPICVQFARFVQGMTIFPSTTPIGDPLVRWGHCLSKDLAGEFRPLTFPTPSAQRNYTAKSGHRRHGLFCPLTSSGPPATKQPATKNALRG